MADITAVILADHEWFREQFAKLDELQAATWVSRGALEKVWRPLADRLDVHAYIEERIFYPQLLKRGADDPVGETLDAIGDHNDIRDGVRDANAAMVGTGEWWAAVGRAREANDDHMASTAAATSARRGPNRRCERPRARPSATASAVDPQGDTGGAGRGAGP